MKTKHISIIALVALCFANCNSQASDREVVPSGSNIILNNDSIVIGEAVSYKNLQVFPVMSELKYARVNFIMLSEALQKQMAIVKETGNVGQLQIDNLSDDYIFILAGDIVKGGRQDRTMGNDVIVAPRARNVPLESFCVEAGRWQQRGNEESDHFSDNSKMLSSKELKLASRQNKDQSEVWRKVSEEQEKLKANVSKIKGQPVEVKSADSQTSLQLTLENKDLEDIVKEYRDNISGLNQLADNTIGFAYAINGELFGIDLYYDNALFNNMRQKLFDAVIVEAISELESDSSFAKADVSGISSLLTGFNKPAQDIISVNPHTSLEVTETDKAVKFETKLSDSENKWIRKNYLVKTRGDNTER